MDIRRFLAELRGRGVYRIAALYAAGSWALLQVADLFFPILGLPDWAITSLLGVAALGFPVAVSLAWVFDLTRHGIVETDSARVDFGELHLSPLRMAELLLIVALVCLVGFLYLERLTSDTPAGAGEAAGTARDERPSIAVMAFENMSTDPSAEYFGDGLAEEILNLLARLNELNVAARTSSFYFKHKAIDLREVGEKLGVGHVLEGSVRRSGDQVRVTAQLIEMDTGFHIWSQTFDRNYSSLFQIQDEIARQVVDALQVILSDSSREILNDRPTLAPGAYDFYLRGREYLRNSLNREGLTRALEMFRRALAAEPEYAEAFAGLCDSWLQLYAIERNPEQYQNAERACQQALLHGGDQVSVLVALGNLYQVSGKTDQALAQYDRALELAPTSVDARLGLAETYWADNQPERAENTYLSAIQQKPNDWRAYIGMAGFLFESGRFSDAIPYYEWITELMPDRAEAFNGLGAAYSMLGDFEASTQALKRSLQIAPSAIAYSNAGTSLFFLHRFREASEMYLKAVEHGAENFQWWGNLGDAYRHAEGLGKLAEPAFRHAIKLANASLKINPADAQTLGLLAHYHASVGDRDQALGYIARARALAPHAVYVYYNTATALCALGDFDGAIKALRQAVGKGYPKQLVVVDANLCSLGERPEFQPSAVDS